MTDNELPGMWESADLSGGEADGYERRLPVRAADAAQYAREPIPEADRGRIRVRLLNATPDPLGSIAALCEQYKGHVIRSLSEITDEQRRACLDDMASTVLNGPLEAAQFHWQIEGVTRSITHQMVRSRSSFFAQESLRFAVPEGNWADEIPYPPSLSHPLQEPLQPFPARDMADRPERVSARAVWRGAMMDAQESYERLIEAGVPAEEARGILPHDMPTRIQWVCDLRTLLAEAGKRTCTQAQFPWRLIFAGMANALRERAMHAPNAMGKATYQRPNFAGNVRPAFDGWQFQLIADKIRPVCYQTGSCGFMAKFDRSCSIRARVDANAAIRRESKYWHMAWIGTGEPGSPNIEPIHDYEWAADPAAARS